MKLDDTLEKRYNCLAEEINFIRQKSIRGKKKNPRRDLNKPVSFWIKRERLLDEIGKEFTIILKTRGCGWALSESGGCSMCGYIEDAAIDDIDQKLIIEQFEYAVQQKLEEIQNDSHNYAIKLFNSGSFFDEAEISPNTRLKIYKNITLIPNIKEVTVESRIEFINRKILEEMLDFLKYNYIEIGIGLETADDHIRNNYINKGLLYDDFLDVYELCKNMGIGIKAYLLFKPPFMNEQAAIDECIYSIKKLIKIGVNTISINPMNIQRGSLVESLWHQKRYRPPWYYSLFKCLRKALNPKDLKKTRIVCDPSGAGTRRGIHNCLDYECNNNMKQKLEEFVLSQDLNALTIEDHNCLCKTQYELQRKYI
ncbi:MAG: TIGR01210 family radical SAM protein [Candidatus Lokiarchaeota archaeon]|nr:TIGR01210 family radical SAM protein [Candidatus Lokiarchaeota archaeon]MBD3199919.1 TIGR01210 family radical SAM protein [Candidatus Lokiarchaeota archaeon]